jgi:hypothetical protein
MHKFGPMEFNNYWQTIIAKNLNDRNSIPSPLHRSRHATKEALHLNIPPRYLKQISAEV